MAFKEITNTNPISSYWPAKAAERKVGDSVEGKYTGKMERDYPDGTKSTLYILETADGKVGVNSSATIARAMSQIPEGSTVKIIYDGKQKSQKTGREFNMFKVYLDEDTTPDKKQEGDDEEIDLSNMAF